jgi:hypothetical protein
LLLIFQEWEQKFSRIAGLRSAVLTGDTNTSLADCLATDIILSTPEKVQINTKEKKIAWQYEITFDISRFHSQWDSMTRKWKNFSQIIGTIKLLMVQRSFTWTVQ